MGEEKDSNYGYSKLVEKQKTTENKIVSKKNFFFLLLLKTKISLSL
jgi:hypothetical protein